MEALRYNDGKLRYDLLEPHAIKELVKVFTKGAEKYPPRNWEKGMSWCKMLASINRHLAAFAQGEDYDTETSLHHMAHVAWNALGLVTFMRTHPELDDRQHSYLQPKRIGLYIDECIADFSDSYSLVTNANQRPDHWQYCYNMGNNFNKWRESGTLDVMNANIRPLLDGATPPFEPACYITNRPVEKHIIEQWLKKHNFPLNPVFSTVNRTDKVQVAIEQKLDYFIDDNYETFVEMNNAGICCFLMDAAHNHKYDVGYKRILNFTDFKNRFL